MSNSLVTINLVVLNGEKYIHRCLSSVLAQTYSHDQIEINILDNGSTDETKDIIRNWELGMAIKATARLHAVVGNSSFATLNFIESGQNLGMWPGHEELLKHSAGKYVIVLSVDVILDKDFISNTVRVMDKDEKIGALQAKIYSYNIGDVGEGELSKEIIDTCGFKIFKSRRIINIGHGEKDDGRFNQKEEIFAVEGAVPVFRKEAFEDCRIARPSTVSGSSNEIADHDIFWYGEDLDVAWRMRVFGWKQIFVPNVIAWHDRQTTKNLRKTFGDFLSTRMGLPLRKRRLEWRNVRFTIIKNDYTINILKDLPFILKREIMMLGYIIIFEPKVLGEVPTFFRLLPKILRKRREIMKRKVASPKEMRKWFN